MCVYNKTNAQQIIIFFCSIQICIYKMKEENRKKKNVTT